MKKTVVIKIGGVFSADEENLQRLAGEMKELNKEYQFIILHGGGAEVSALSRHFGIEPVFKEGIRVTTREEMKYVDKVLSGKINKRLVRLFQKEGFNAVGLTGSDGRIFTGESISQGGKDPQHTGKITAVNPRLPQLLLDNGYMPIMGSTSMDKKGQPLNINADDAALAVAEGMKVYASIFLSDIPGILKAEEVIKKITPEQIEKEIEEGVITGGMIPKVKSSVKALASGVTQIIIGWYKEEGALNKLLDGSTGTHITQ